MLRAKNILWDVVIAIAAALSSVAFEWEKPLFKICFIAVMVS